MAPIVLFLIAISVIAAVFAFNDTSAIAQTSDSVQSFVEGYAAAHGNALLSGWNVALDDYYFTDTIPYALAETIAGPRAFLLRLIPALTYALFVFVSLVIGVDRARSATYAVTVGAAEIFMLAIPASLGVWNPLLLSNMHLATVVGALISLGLCGAIARAGQASSQSRAIFAAALVAVVAATTASDPFSVVFAFGPALAVLSVDAFLRRPERGERLAFLSLTAGVLFGIALPFVIGLAGGFSTENIVLTRVVSWRLLGRNLDALFAGVLSLAGANPYVGPLSIWSTALVAMRILALVIAVAAVANIARNLFSKRAPLIDRLLCAGILADLAACASSMQFAKGIVTETLWGGGPPMRYAMPAVLFAMLLGAMFIARLVAEIRDRRGAASAALTFLAVLTLFLNDYTLTRSQWAAGNPALTAARWLDSRALTTGIGEYWSANLVTAMSENAVRVASVIPRGGKLVPYVLSADRNWYATPPQFVIWQEPNKTALSLADVRATYPVCETGTVAGYHIALLARGGTCFSVSKARDAR